ncbi:MAG: DUF308 domain-containing protein [Alphaproteobacteria bacterium]|nr:DUF308 domain-containing protein [Alphaproteobacteria bacterium]
MKKTIKKSRKENQSIAAAVRRLYDKSAPLLVCESLLFVVAGVFLLIKPVAILTALTFIIGIGLVLFGLYRTISGFVTSHNIGGGWFDVLFGLVNIVLGVLFCVYPVNSLISVVYIFVILFLFKALRALIFAINMVRAKFGHYIFNLIMTIILVALAVALLFFPLAGAIAMVYYMAITLFLYAIADIYMFIELMRLKRIVDK